MGVLISFEELENKISEISKNYFIAKDALGRKGIMLSCGDEDEDNPYLDYIKHIDETYLSLKDEDKVIINNEFFYNSFPDWWKVIYSRPSFYRKKKEAMKAFLKAYQHV